MLIAVFLSAKLIILACFAIARRPRFMGFACLKAGGAVKNKIVRIETRVARNAGAIAEKLRREIRIFNKMKLVMPCRRGVSVMYSQFLGRLIIEPRFVTRKSDGIARLLYICAAANLYIHSRRCLEKRQLIKNCIYVFGQKNIIKKVCKMNLLQRRLYTHKQVRFKYLNGRFIFAQNRVDRPSYTVYGGGDGQTQGTFKKHYVDKVLPIECFETNVERFSYFVSNDKYNYNLSHTSDTFYAIGNGSAVGLYVPGKVTFGSSICEKGNGLNIYASGNDGKYYIVHGKSKQDIIPVVGEIKRRRGQLDYLLTAGEAKEVAQIEAIFECAWGCRFVRGDGLKNKFPVACKYVPTLFLPTLVHIVDKADDFFKVVDNFKLFEKIAATGNNLNIVFLYSSMNDEVREIMKAFANKEEAKDLISKGIFLFFVDRVKAKEAAVNYLSLMSETKTKVKITNEINKSGIEIVTHISNSFPITHTVYVRNTIGHPRTAKVQIPLCVGSELDGLPFGIPAICQRQGANLQVTSLKSGRSVNYKLPIGASVMDEFGRLLADNEIACQKVYIACDMKLAAFEEKIVKIIKGEGGLSRVDRKQAFLGSLENVSIKGNPRLQRLFEIGIAEGVEEKLCASLKESIRNFERDVFFALLGNRESIPHDVYALITERVIGIKLLRGKIQLMPCIMITGNFELTFTYQGVPYSFKVKEKGSGFAVNYGDTEHKNFFELPIASKVRGS